MHTRPLAVKAALRPAGSLSYAARVQRLCDFMRNAGALFGGVSIEPSEATGRGLVSEHVFREGATLMSVPVHALTVSADRLLETSESLRALKPPALDTVAHLMTSHSIQDPVLYEQVHLSLLLAAEHNNPESPYNVYLDTLPHPAVDDAAVIALHKDSVDPTVLIEWDDHQREFLSLLRALLRRWGPQAPPVEVAYWALRTVLARMHMLPARGVAPEDMGSTLSYTALSSVDRAKRQNNWIRRFKATVGAVMGNPAAGEDYRLVPTLVPLLDLAGHVPSGNVQVEMTSRDGVGSCVELRAIRPIEKGEEIGLRYNTSQSHAFLLYRFGFVPM